MLFRSIPGEVRQATRALLDLVDDGTLDARQALAAALGWMTDDEVEDMATANAFLEYEDEDEDDSSFDESMRLLGADEHYYDHCGGY